MENIRVSVILCTHNPRPDYINRVIGALAKQTLDYNSWELIVVDNASDAPVRKMIEIDWHPRAKIVVELEIGTRHARNRGYLEMQSNLAIFVDDDNILDPEYLQKSMEIADKHQNIGVWSGQSTGEFETTPPSWTEPYLKHLAIRKLDRDYWANYLNYTSQPFGAGMCVRRNVLNHFFFISDFPLRNHFGTSGVELSRGEDSDLAFSALNIGMGIGLFRSLKLDHLIPNIRLKEDYLLRLIEETTYSNVIVRYLHLKEIPESRKSVIGLIARKLRCINNTAMENKFEQARQRGYNRAHILIKKEIGLG